MAAWILVLAAAVAGQGCLQDAHALGDLGVVPSGAVLFVEGDQCAVLVDARGAAGVVQQHQREQPGDLGLVAGQRQLPGEADRFGGQVDPAGVALVEDQVQHAQHDRDVAGLRERLAADRPLRAADALRHRRLGNQERLGNLSGRQPADGAQRERDRRRRAQRRMAAQEQQQQRVVGRLGRSGLGLVTQHFLAPAPRRLGSPRVDQLAARDGEQPALRVIGPPVTPDPVRLQKRVLHRVLGGREVVPATDEDGEHLRRQDADDLLVHSTAAGASPITGRTSIHS